jgi:hypothetical protein
MNEQHPARQGRLTAAQLRVFDELLAIGGPRPVAPGSLVDHLRGFIAEGVRETVAAWPESSLWVGKSMITSTLRCEGQVLAEASQPRSRRIPTPTAIGIVVHRAIQMQHTHPGRSPEEMVRLALAGSRCEESFATWEAGAGEWEISDLIVAAVNRLCAYLDTFPPLDTGWVPRFEDSISARFPGMTLAARPDLSLGRPRGDGRQTMFLCDFKSTDLRDEHLREAQFYALVATLRNGVPPFRSCVLSLSSGEWTDPDIDADVLESVAHDVVVAVRGRVEVLRELRAPELRAGRHCDWCPARTTCPAAAALVTEGDLVALGAAVRSDTLPEPIPAPKAKSRKKSDAVRIMPVRSGGSGAEPLENPWEI